MLFKKQKKKMEKKKLNLSKDDINSLALMAMAENGDQSDDVVKMTIQSALSRLNSGRTKEFGGSLPEVLKKGYYAIKRPNGLYKTLTSGNELDMPTKTRLAAIKKLTEAVVGDQDYGNAQFYFTPQEVKRLTASKAFNFGAVKPMGNVGMYQTFGY